MYSDASSQDKDKQLENILCDLKERFNNLTQNPVLQATEMWKTLKGHFGTAGHVKGDRVAMEYPNTATARPIILQRRLSVVRGRKSLFRQSEQTFKNLNTHGSGQSKQEAQFEMPIIVTPNTDAIVFQTSDYPRKKDRFTRKVTTISADESSQNEEKRKYSEISTPDGHEDADRSVEVPVGGELIFVNKNEREENLRLAQPEPTTTTIVTKANEHGDRDEFEMDHELTSTSQMLQSILPHKIASDFVQQVAKDDKAKDTNAPDYQRVTQNIDKYVAPRTIHDLMGLSPIVETPGYAFTFTEEELSVIFQNGNCVIKRTDWRLETGKFYIWQVVDSGASTLKLKAYKPNPNGWLHISRGTEGMVEETREFGAEVETIILEKNFKQIFAHYLPIYVDKISDSTEMSVVMLYRDAHYLPNFTNFIQTLAYYAMIATFFENVLYKDLEIASAETEIHKLRTGWFETVRLIKTTCKSFAMSPRWSSGSVLLPILKHPKMTITPIRCHKKPKCDGCQNSVQPSHEAVNSVTLDGRAYDYDTLLSYPKGHPFNHEKRKQVFQFCDSCAKFLKSFHAFYHMPHHVLAATYFRLKIMHEFPQDATWDSPSVRKAWDADTDWYKRLRLELIMVRYSQILKDIDQMGRCNYSDASHPPNETEFP